MCEFRKFNRLLKYKKLNLHYVVPENDNISAAGQVCGAIMGENKQPNTPWHFKYTRLRARGRKLQPPKEFCG
jgi:hypothetical protein